MSGWASGRGTGNGVRADAWTDERTKGGGGRTADVWTGVRANENGRANRGTDEGTGGTADRRTSERERGDERANGQAVDYRALFIVDRLRADLRPRASASVSAIARTPSG